MTHERKVWKVSFFPIKGKNSDGSITDVGRWMCFISCKSPHEIDGILKEFLPELFDEGFDVEDSVAVRSENMIWSVSIGPPGRTHSILVEAPDEQRAMESLIASTISMPLFSKHVASGLFISRRIDLSRDGVW